MPGPLSETFSRLQAAVAQRHLVVGEPGPGWVAWDRLSGDDDLLDAWFARILGGAAAGRADVAGSFLVIAATGTLVDVAATVLLAEQRAFSLGAADLAVHRDPAGFCDGLAVISPAVVVLPGDPAAAHPDAQVSGSPAELTRQVGAALADVLEPVFGAIRRRAPFGRPGMWGAVADQVGLIASRLARFGGVGHGCWPRSVELLDAVAARAPALRSRPHPLSVPFESGTRLFSIRGTCCLLYKVSPGADRTTGAGYCATCPLLRPEVQATLLAGWARNGW